jgi:hypothetical protein
MVFDSFATFFILLGGLVILTQQKHNRNNKSFFLSLLHEERNSLGKWTYKSPVFLGENQEFSIFWPKNRAFFPITTGTYKSISLD